MNRLTLLLLILLFNFSNLTNAQEDTCDSPEEDLIELNSISKCEVENPKRKNNDNRNLGFKATKKRSHVLRRKSNRKLAVSVSNDVDNKAVNSVHSVLEIAHQEQWEEIKDIAETISENSEKLDDEGIINFNAVEEIPLFSYCENYSDSEKSKCFNNEMSNHIKRHFKYPKEALKKFIQGCIIVEFTIDENGSIQNIQTTGDKSVKLLKEEATRVVEQLPRFLPGKHNGKAVGVKYVMPVNFKI